MLTDKDEREFKLNYMAAFLGGYAAVHYIEQCQNGWKDKNWQPVEDAETLANKAWERLQETI